MARPRFDGVIHTVRLSLRLREGEDDDLISFFEQLGERGRARAVVQALRNGGMVFTGDDADDEDDGLTDALVGMMM